MFDHIFKYEDYGCTMSNCFFYLHVTFVRDTGSFKAGDTVNSIIFDIRKGTLSVCGVNVLSSNCEEITKISLAIDFITPKAT